MTGSIDSRKWYNKKRWILSLLLLFPPLGIPLLWRTSWARPLKITGTISSLLLLLALANDSGKEATETTASTPIATPTPIASTPIATSMSTSANSFNFPQSTCGDPAADSGATWYPVFVDGGDLQQLRSQYCADAVAAVREKTGAAAVQLASFTQRDRAEAFAQAVNGEVGRPSPSDPMLEPTVSTPIAEATPVPAPVIVASPAASSKCDPAYPDLCLPPNAEDLDCRDVATQGFQVLPPDPHGFDRDRDGIGCES